MKLDINEDNIESFKVVVWLCLVIGLWNMYLYMMVMVVILNHGLYPNPLIGYGKTNQKSKP